MSVGDEKIIGLNPGSKRVEPGSDRPRGAACRPSGTDPADKGGEPTATRRPSHPIDQGLLRCQPTRPAPELGSLSGMAAKAVQSGMREQGQLTFNLEDSVPEAPRHFSPNHNGEGEKVVEGESGRSKTVSDNYWSSTSNPNNTDNALNANFSNGNLNNNNKTNTNYVRAVRGGKWHPSPPLISKPGRGDIFSLENIYAAYLKCRRRKRNTVNALKFELNLEENVVNLHRQLNDRTYLPSRSILFAATKPKLREIFHGLKVY